MLRMMLARDSHLGHGRKFSTGQGLQAAAWARNLLQLRRLGVTAGCKCTVWQLHSANNAQGGAEGAELQLRSCCCHGGDPKDSVERRTFQTLGSSMCQQSSHTPPLGGHSPPFGSALSRSGFVCCTHLSSHSTPWSLPCRR